MTFTEAHHLIGNHEEELKTLKERLAGQKQEMLNLKMEIDAKDSQLQNARTTDALTPKSLNQSRVPGYFHYSTGFSLSAK